jgi:hypothetical protein
MLEAEPAVATGLAVPICPVPPVPTVIVKAPASSKLESEVTTPPPPPPPIYPPAPPPPPTQRISTSSFDGALIVNVPDEVNV